MLFSCQVSDVVCNGLLRELASAVSVCVQKCCQPTGVWEYSFVGKCAGAKWLGLVSGNIRCGPGVWQYPLSSAVGENGLLSIWFSTNWLSILVELRNERMCSLLVNGLLRELAMRFLGWCLGVLRCGQCDDAKWLLSGNSLANAVSVCVQIAAVNQLVCVQIAAVNQLVSGDSPVWANVMMQNGWCLAIPVVVRCQNGLAMWCFVGNIGCGVCVPTDE